MIFALIALIIIMLSITFDKLMYNHVVSHKLSVTAYIKAMRLADVFTFTSVITLVVMAIFAPL